MSCKIYLPNVGNPGNPYCRVLDRPNVMTQSGHYPVGAHPKSFHYTCVGAHPKSFGANLLKCVPTWDCTIPATLKSPDLSENKNIHWFLLCMDLWSSWNSLSIWSTSPLTGYQLDVSVKVIALKDVRDVSPIRSLILWLGWVLWSTRPCLKETLIGF